MSIELVLCRCQRTFDYKKGKCPHCNHDVGNLSSLDSVPSLREPVIDGKRGTYQTLRGDGYVSVHLHHRRGMKWEYLDLREWFLYQDVLYLLEGNSLYCYVIEDKQKYLLTPLPEGFGEKKLFVTADGIFILREEDRGGGKIQSHLYKVVVGDSEVTTTEFSFDGKMISVCDELLYFQTLVYPRQSDEFLVKELQETLDDPRKLACLNLKTGETQVILDTLVAMDRHAYIGVEKYWDDWYEDEWEETLLKFEATNYGILWIVQDILAVNKDYMHCQLTSFYRGTESHAEGYRPDDYYFANQHSRDYIFDFKTNEFFILPRTWEIKLEDSWFLNTATNELWNIPKSNDLDRGSERAHVYVWDHSLQGNPKVYSLDTPKGSSGSKYLYYFNKKQCWYGSEYSVYQYNLQTGEISDNWFNQFYVSSRSSPLWLDDKYVVLHDYAGTYLLKQSGYHIEWMKISLFADYYKKETVPNYFDRPSLTTPTPSLMFRAEPVEKNLIAEPKSDNLRKIYTMTYKGGVASGYFSGENQEFIVTKGSFISESIADSCPKGIIDLRKKYQEDIVANYLQTDIAFSSVSAAAAFVAGSSKNGWVSWKNQQGQTIKEEG